MSQANSPKIVIVGGGTAGISVAARLRKRVSNAGITIIEPSDKHYYQPLWTLVGGGICDKTESERPEESVIPSGVDWVRDSVATFEPEANSLTTAGGQSIGYDYLVVAPGMQLDWAKIEGMPDALGKDGVTSNYSYDIVERTAQFLNEFRGGTAIFTMPTGPIKCAGAPQKILYLAEEIFRKNGVRSDSRVIFASGGAAIFGIEHYAKTLRKIIEDRGIETKFKHNLVAVRPDSKEAVFDNLDTGEKETIQYDFIHVVPPMSAPDFVKQSPLADSAGFVEVDKFTTQHTRYANVFSLGDASSLPTSRTGAAVRKEAPVTVANLAAVIEGREPTAKYDGYASCPLVTAHNRVVLAEFGYDGKVMETFPFDQSKERYSMWLLKRYGLPTMYWNGMLRGRM